MPLFRTPIPATPAPAPAPFALARVGFASNVAASLRAPVPAASGGAFSLGGSSLRTLITGSSATPASSGSSTTPFTLPYSPPGLGGGGGAAAAPAPAPSAGTSDSSAPFSLPYSPPGLGGGGGGGGGGDYGGGGDLGFDPSTLAPQHADLADIASVGASSPTPAAPSFLSQKIVGPVTVGAIGLAGVAALVITKVMKVW